MNYRLLSLGALSLALLTTHVEGSSLRKEKVEHDAVLYDNAEDVKEESFESRALSLYESLALNNFEAPSEDVFAKALKGYLKLKDEGEIKNEKLTIVDFSLSSAMPRLWVIDMVKQEVLLQSLVSHGRNTGDEFATVFSDKVDSHMSSLGFYKTGETYQGINGFSMRLDGLEAGINSNARKRAIVIHGADYASLKLVKAQGRLGRSYGCPAVPVEVNKKLIELIKDESCLFIYHPSKDYLSKSHYLS
ncbi:murein L,D-transpeptidase catalytic domain family protein [Myroides indicus]|uniref:L,D-transpeptidase-like protein n=1 Tax=Myroides indicus TaxID=1323422 RepID=A0A4R7F093_9FLAO|nr:murein L,D-transpeptidase catalytic domain family protein [Myroides indicus]TDS60168.1 L,D-transpeptidase-like protein [Myroides indicus]